MYLKKVILFIYIVMGDYLECFIVIMMDVFVDLVYGKVVFFNIYYLLKFMKMLIDIMIF